MITQEAKKTEKKEYHCDTMEEQPNDLNFKKPSFYKKSKAIFKNI